MTLYVKSQYLMPRNCCRFRPLLVIHFSDVQHTKFVQCCAWALDLTYRITIVGVPACDNPSWRSSSVNIAWRVSTLRHLARLLLRGPFICIRHSVNLAESPIVPSMWVSTGNSEAPVRIEADRPWDTGRVQGERLPTKGTSQRVACGKYLDSPELLHFPPRVRSI